MLGYLINTKLIPDNIKRKSQHILIDIQAVVNMLRLCVKRHSKPNIGEIYKSFTNAFMFWGRILF